MDYEKDITANKLKLINATDCTKILLDLMEEKNIFCKADTSSLMAKSDVMERASSLWDLLTKKVVTLEKLIEIFEAVKQTAVVSILKVFRAKEKQHN